MVTPNRLRADTHVHFHDCFEEGAFLDAAANAMCPEVNAADRVHAVLCLTESYGANWFARLFALESEAPLGTTQWHARPTNESNSVVLEDSRGRKMSIIAGRQIVCAEGLEVLALGCNEMLQDRQSIFDVLRRVTDIGAIAVVPWGFGKWVGSRGKLVKELIENPPCRFLLGDNGGRLSLWPEPSMFAAAQERGFRLLPGTDPFPFRWDCARVGSFGIEWSGSLAEETPFAGLRKMLDSSDMEGRRYGRLEQLPAFIRNQLAIQLRRFAR